MSESELFSGLKQGLEEAISHVRGDLALETREVRPNPQYIRTIRERTAKTRLEFERKFGVPARTVQDWEQGRRSPDVTARVYLAIIDRDPKQVAALYAAVREPENAEEGWAA